MVPYEDLDFTPTHDTQSVQIQLVYDTQSEQIQTFFEDEQSSSLDYDSSLDDSSSMNNEND